MPKFPNPAEFPEGGVEGGGVFRRPGTGINEINEFPREDEFRFPPNPGIKELRPGPEWAGGNVRFLAREVFRLRQRVYSLESSMLFSTLGFGGHGGGVAELEPGPDWGSWGTWRNPGLPGEINEFPRIDTLQQIANLETRLASLETTLLKSIQELSANIEGLNS